jgi:hypothetical protein
MNQTTQIKADAVNTKVAANSKPHLDRVEIEGESYYRISNVQEMQPFFMNVVSDNNLWMFIASNGGLSAGRVNANGAIFPYYTDDKITQLAATAGNLSFVRMMNESGEMVLWRPMDPNRYNFSGITRNIYKNLLGNRILFEEINEQLGLSFQYGWSFSKEFGLVRNATLMNHGRNPIELEILDGIQNILPAGVSSHLQNWRSNLVNAYRKSELLEPSNIGVYSLSSRIIDKPEPSESLSASLAWSYGMEDADILLSTAQVRSFVKGLSLTAESDIRAEPGAYFLHRSMVFQPGMARSWGIVVDTGKSAEDIAGMEDLLMGNTSLRDTVNQDIQAGSSRLSNLIGMADGWQTSADSLCTSRHISNVLFNILRGGVFVHGYHIEIHDFTLYLKTHNKELYKKYESELSKLGNRVHRDELIKWSRKEVSLQRIAGEYLPLYFSRRHGDPSRPWNEFNIHTQSETGEIILDYEGNWRDIFQNWEALAWSFPGYLDAMISRFLNASTADGYNPYRITRHGIDWEVVDPHDPWSFIGYWGDHQIIYLLKFLELKEKISPGSLTLGLNEKAYTFANVPYRIRVFDELVRDPYNTIDFDEKEEERIGQRVEQLGADGKLLMNREGMIIHVSLAEKLLIPLLAKLSNYVHEGGIWLNTQRPEWNDANNALVGNGLSMVTLQYIRRYIVFLRDVFTQPGTLVVSAEVKGWLKELNAIFREFSSVAAQYMDDEKRMQLLSMLGHAAQHYNQQVYAGLSGYTAELDQQTIHGFLQMVLTYTDHTISVNKRDDKLYHSYNLLELDSEKGTASVHHMYEMLEGQVAVLSSGILNATQCVELLDALKESAMYREDQYSYLLYPDRQLATFMERNTFDSKDRKVLLDRLADQQGNKVVNRDINGKYHFYRHITNANDLEAQIDSLADRTGMTLNAEEKESLLDLFEEVFRHSRFTGRSGTFYGYEGLNSIYWHMVSKLLLAVQESILDSRIKQEDPVIVNRLIDHYYEIRAGIGLNKDPQVFGAFPTDPYSHTPGHKGVQQPGMTGQVKEDVITRMGELGVRIEEGTIRFSGRILRSSEFVRDSSSATPYLDFTVCEVPVRYLLTANEEYVVINIDGNEISLEGNRLDEETSQSIFQREGRIRKVDVFIRPHLD